MDNERSFGGTACGSGRDNIALQCLNVYPDPGQGQLHERLELLSILLIILSPTSTA